MYCLDKFVDCLEVRQNVLVAIDSISVAILKLSFTTSSCCMVVYASAAWKGREYEAPHNYFDAAYWFHHVMCVFGGMLSWTKELRMIDSQACKSTMFLEQYLRIRYAEIHRPMPRG